MSKFLVASVALSSFPVADAKLSLLAAHKSPKRSQNQQIPLLAQARNGATTPANSPSAVVKDEDQGQEEGSFLQRMDESSSGQTHYQLHLALNQQIPSVTSRRNFCWGITVLLLFAAVLLIFGVLLSKDASLLEAAKPVFAYAVLVALFACADQLELDELTEKQKKLDRDWYSDTQRPEFYRELSVDHRDNVISLDDYTRIRQAEGEGEGLPITDDDTERVVGREGHSCEVVPDSEDESEPLLRSWQKNQ